MVHVLFFLFLEFFLFSDHLVFMFDLFLFLIVNAIIKHPCHIAVCKIMLSLIKCLSVRE